MLKYIFILLGFLVMAFGYDEAVLAKEHSTAAQKEQKGIKCWTFGQSSGRNAALWKKGVTAQDVKNRSTPSGALKKPKNSSDRAKEEKSGFNGGLSVESQKRSWDITPDKTRVRPDEMRYREGRHVFRAFADVAPSDKLDINIGPELIVKDDQTTSNLSNSTQPDAALGMGMNFKLDF